MTMKVEEIADSILAGRTFIATHEEVVEALKIVARRLDEYYKNGFVPPEGEQYFLISLRHFVCETERHEILSEIRNEKYRKRVVELLALAGR